MDRRLHTWTVAVVVLLLLSSGLVPAAAQDSTSRTPWGDPDLQGVWDFRTITPLQRPESFGDRAFLTEEEASSLEQETIARNQELLERPAERAPVGDNVDRRADGSPGFYNNFWLDGGTSPIETRRTSLVVDPANGRIPDLVASARERLAEQRRYREVHPADSWLDRSAYDRCLLGFNAGPPITPGGYNQNLQIVQTPHHVALVTEMVHTHRIVPLDGRAHLTEDIEQWSGDSRGYWEGGTLVVETRNFRADRGWRGSTGSMTLVERFTRVDEGRLDYEYTVTDPDTWARPWTALLPMTLSPEPMYEYACHEGNYSMPGILAGQRAEDRAQPASR